jgi:aspartyl-tRNA synthetase
MLEAIIDEVEKQLDYYVNHNSFRPDQTTVLFDADTKQTKTMRKKEHADDYRYAIDSDIPFVNIEKTIRQSHVDEKS